MTDYETFNTFMTDIWNNGGPAYDQWHNARTTARRKYNAHPNCPSSRDGERGHIYSFPDNSRVFIAHHGGMIQYASPPQPHRIAAHLTHLRDASS